MVTKRLVFFVGGFDPKGSSSFCQQQRASLAAHSTRHGGQYSVGPRTPSSGFSYRWNIQASGASAAAGTPVNTQFEYLAWDDLVRGQWARTPLALAREALGSLRDFGLSGAMARLYRLSNNVVLAATLPIALVLGACLAVALAGVAAAMVAQAIGLAGGWRWVVVVGTVAATTLAGYRGLRRVPSTWFMRVVDFARSYAQAHSAGSPLQQRTAAWGQHIGRQLETSAADEVLLVGYSAGSILCTAVMAHVLRHTPAAAHPRISMLTLGNCIPVPAALAGATHLRQDLVAIGNAKVRWLDVTSPIDWGSFALCDPVCIFAGGQASPERKFISPQFHLLFSADTYRQLKKDKYRVHQQYLQTTELLGRYDYFSILCGPLSLQERFYTR
jgi:hypothetical protein